MLSFLLVCCFSIALAFWVYKRKGHHRTRKDCRKGQLRSKQEQHIPMTEFNIFKRKKEQPKDQKGGIEEDPGSESILPENRRNIVSLYTEYRRYY